MEKRSFWSLYRPGNAFPAMHGFRIIAIIIVLQFHTTSFFYETQLISQLSDIHRLLSLRSIYGMDAFFFLSGFLIGNIFMIEVKTLNQASVLRYCFRRILRTFPLYYFTLFIIALIFGLNEIQKANLWKEIFFFSNYPFSYDYLMMWSWSLSVEEHFYFLTPIFFLLLNYFSGHKKKILLMLVLFASGTLVRYLTLKGYLYEGSFTDYARSAFHGTQSRYDQYIAGFLTVYLQKNFSAELIGFFKSNLMRKLFWLIPALIFIAINFPYNLSEEIVVPRSYFSAMSLPGLSIEWVYTLTFGTLSSFAFVMLSLYILNTQCFLSKLFSHQYFYNASSLGYGVFLNHVVVITTLILPLSRWLLSLGMRGTMLWVVCFTALLLLSVFFSYLMHIFIEKPFLALRKRICP